MQRRGRLILGGIVLLAAVLVAGVWLVPGMLDWNRYRGGIAALASQQLGRPVHIGGSVSLQLLPQPILTASDVSVEGGQADEHGAAVGDGMGPDGIGLRARALRLRVALGPLLAGKVDARELTLQGADLRLPWPPPAGALAQRPPSWLTGLQARVEDGRLQVGQLVFTGIEGTIATDPETGTLAVAGVLQSGGATARTWQFTARLGRPGGDGAAGLDVSLDGQERLRDTGGTFSGQIGADGALSGRVAGRGPDLSLLMPAPALPWRTDGRLNAAGGLAIADELALEIGGAPATGAVALRVAPQAQLDVAITAGRLDLDAWLPALLARNSGSLRAGIPTGIDLSAEAATLAGGTVRRLRGGVDVAAGVVHLRDVTAVLPGEAELTVSGQVTTDPAPRFDGPVKVRAPDLRSTLQWLHGVLPAWAGLAPAGALRGADLSAHVTADAGQGGATELTGTLDGSRIGGSASYRAARDGGAPGTGVRAGVTVALTLDTAALDPWLRWTDPFVEVRRGGIGLMRTLEAGLAGLRTVDADVRITAGQSTWRELPMGAVAVELSSETSRVWVRRIEAQPLGAHVNVSGQVGEGGRLSDGRLEVSTADLSRLRPLLEPLLAVDRWAGLQGLLHGQGSLLVLAAGPADALGGRLTAEVGDLRLEAQPVVDLARRHWAGPVTLHHPGAPRLLEMLGLSGTAAWLGDGSLSLVGQADVSPGRVALDGATLSAGAMRATGTVVFEGGRAFGTVGFETLPLPLVYPRSPEPLPFRWLLGWQARLEVQAAELLLGLTPVLSRLSTDVTLEAGVLSFGKASARLQGGVLTGRATLDASADPPTVMAEAQLAGLSLSGPVFDMPLDVVAGQAEAAGTVSAAGNSPAALLATAHGQAVVRVHAGVASGFDLTAAGGALTAPDPVHALETARQALLSGSTSFATLEGPVTVERGAVVVDLGLTSPAGTVRLTGGLDLQASGLDMRLSFEPAGPDAGPGPVLGERWTGPAGAAVRTPELAGLARWLADRP